MNELDFDTIQWLNSLQLGKQFKTYADFQNGYNFGLIFQRLNIIRGYKFKNNSDMASIFHNYKNVKGLLMQNFQFDFPINNIIYSTQPLLNKVKELSIKFLQKKNEKIQTIISNQSTLRSNQDKYSPNKTQLKNFNNIDTKNSPDQHSKTKTINKLQRFKEEKERQQLNRRDQKKRQTGEDKYNKFMQDQQKILTQSLIKQEDKNNNVIKQSKKVEQQWLEQKDHNNKQKYQQINKQAFNEEKQDIKNEPKEIKKNKIVRFKNDDERQAQLRQDRIASIYKDVERLQQRYAKHKSYAKEILEILLHITIVSEANYDQKTGFTYKFCKKVQELFNNYKPTLKLPSFQVNNKSQLQKYITYEGQWQLYEEREPGTKNNSIAGLINDAIQISYPSKSLVQQKNIPLYMPLRIGVMGNRLSGKTTIAQKLANRYGLIIIDPTLIIKQALQKAKPPVEDTNKKGAKKDAKKPEQESPQSLAIKQFGLKLLSQIQNLQEANPRHYLQAIKFKLKQSFTLKQNSQIVQQFEEAKDKEAQRYAQALKQFEENQKKPKKDSKKSGVELVVEQPPAPKPYFYHSGFIIQNYPMDIQNLKLLERTLNNYIDQNQKLNPKAQELRKQFSLILPMPQKKVDKNLKSGTFSCLFDLQINLQHLKNRSNGRKIDPQTNIIYHPVFNPPPTDIKGLVERLVEVQPIQIQINDSNEVEKFYSKFGENKHKIQSYNKLKTQVSIEQSLNFTKLVIEKLLYSKYEQIMQMKNKFNTSQQIKQQKPQFDNENSKLSKNMSETVCKQIIQKYSIVYQTYSTKINQSLLSLQGIRKQFSTNVQTIQAKFLKIINQTDQSTYQKIGQFQKSYNSLHQHQPEILYQKEAASHLLQSIQQINDQAWQFLQMKKNKAVLQIEKFKNSTWLNQQVIKYIAFAQSLMQNQLNFFVEQLYFILQVHSLQKGIKIDYIYQYLALGEPLNMQPIPTVDKNNPQNNQKLRFLITQCQKCLDLIPEFIKNKQKKLKISFSDDLESLIKNTINSQQRRVRQRVNKISRFTISRILQMQCYYQILLNKMDDWTLFGIKLENDCLYQIIKSIKKQISLGRPIQLTHISTSRTLISQIHHSVQQLSNLIIPICMESPINKIQIYYYRIFLQEIKCLANKEGKIQFKVFVTYFQKRKKHNMFHQELLKIDYDTLQQYLVTEELINYRQLAIASLLIHFPVFDFVLTDYTQDQKFLHFEEFNPLVIPNTNLEEYNLLKKLIFQIFMSQDNKINISNYMETLNMFTQLQVERYGDTIMLMQHTKGNKK